MIYEKNLIPNKAEIIVLIFRLEFGLIAMAKAIKLIRKAKKGTIYMNKYCFESTYTLKI